MPLPICTRLASISNPAPVGPWITPGGPSARCRGGGFRAADSCGAATALAVPALAQRPPPLSALHSPRMPGTTAANPGGHRLRRWWWLPSGPLGRPTRPQRPAGRSPAHPGRRLAAARPVQPPAGSGRGNVAAKAGQARPGLVGRQPLRGGTPPQRKAKPLRGRCAGLALLLPRAGCGAGAPGRPGPHVVGGWGRPPLRPRPAGGRSGPVPLAGGAAPPSRAGAPAAGCCAALAPAGGRNLNAARKGRSGPCGPRSLARMAGGWGAGLRRLRAGCHPGDLLSRARCTGLRPALDRRSPARPETDKVTRPPGAGHRPTTHRERRYNHDAHNHNIGR